LNGEPWRAQSTFRAPQHEAPPHIASTHHHFDQILIHRILSQRLSEPLLQPFGHDEASHVSGPHGDRVCGSAQRGIDAGDRRRAEALVSSFDGVPAAEQVRAVDPIAVRPHDRYVGWVSEDVAASNDYTDHPIRLPNGSA